MTRFRFRLLACRTLALAALTGAGTVRATTYTWNGGGDESIDHGSNWVGGVPPPENSTAQVVFSSSSLSNSSTALNPNLDVNFYVDSLTFAGSAGFTIVSNNSRGLDIGSDGLNQNSTVEQTIQVPTFLTADQTWTFASGAGALTFSGNGLVNLQSYMLTLAPQGNNTLNGNISGTGGLVVNGSGTLALTGTVSLPNEYVGNSGSGVLTQSGGSNTLSGALYLGNNSGANGTYTLSGTGKLSAPYEYVGDSGSGTFTQSGGSNTLSNTLYLGYETSGSGAYTLSGTGSAFSSANEQVGYNGAGTFTQNGGSNTVDNTLCLGYVGGVGAYTLSGTSQLSSGIEIVGYGNQGTNSTFTQSGGTNTVSGSLYIGKLVSINVGPNTYDQYFGQGTYTLGGGLLQAASVIGGGDSTFNFNGGTLRAGASDNPGAANNPSTFFAGLARANVQAGGALIDTNGYNVTVTQALLHDATLSSTADGGLTKLGTGTLTLTRKSTYTGPTTIKGGTLQVDSGGSINGGTVYVDGGTTLALTGTGTLSAPNEYVGFAGTGIFNQSGGTNTVGTQLTLGFYNAATYTLGGGVLQTPGVVVGVGGYTSTFNFNGGTLRASASATSFFSGLTMLNVQTGGATIDTNGYNFTVTQPLLHDTSLGSTADGGLTKQGAGTLTFTGASTYTGATNVNAGTLALSGTGSVSSGGYSGLSVNGSSTSPASVTLADTGSLSTGVAYVGNNGAGTFTQSGGSFTTNGSKLYLGYYSAGNGSYSLSGTGSLSTGAAYVGYGSAGTFTQSGGSFTTNGNALVLGYYNGSSGTYNLGGGTLTAGSVMGNVAVGGTGTFNFSGGTLQAGASTTSFLAELTTANVRGSATTASSGAVVDTQGFNVTVAQNLVHSTLSGDASVDGGLTKLGSGTLTLSGTNTYTGITSVRNGTLLVNGGVAGTSSGTGTGNVTVGSSDGTSVGQIGGTGAISGAVVVYRGSTLMGGSANTAGSLHVGALTLSSGSTFNAYLLSTATYSEVIAGSSSSLNGATLSLTVPGNASFQVGDQLTLISSPNLSGAFANAAPGTLFTQGGYTFQADYSVFNAFDLDVVGAVPEPATWLGGALLLGGAALTLRQRRLHRA